MNATQPPNMNPSQSRHRLGDDRTESGQRHAVVKIEGYVDARDDELVVLARPRHQFEGEYAASRVLKREGVIAGLEDALEPANFEARDMGSFKRPEIVTVAKALVDVDSEAVCKLRLAGDLLREGADADLSAFDCDVEVR